jgi:hypothetical protein
LSFLPPAHAAGPHPRARPPRVVFLLEGLDEIARRDADFPGLPFQLSRPDVVWLCAGRPEGALPGERLESWWNLCTQERKRGLLRKAQPLESESTMSPEPLPPEKQATVEDLARAIREAVDAENSELAANLATTDDAHLFGANEFMIRALAPKIAAKAIEQHLSQK